MYKAYQITNSDSLESIAKSFNTNVEELIKINGNISIIPGTYIVVPYVDTYYDKYIVQIGDTIYKIAARYNIDPNLLILINGLNKDDYLYPNETIVIPKQNYNVYITNENSTLNELYNLGLLEKIINDNTIYLLPNQTILYQKEN